MAVIKSATENIGCGRKDGQNDGWKDGWTELKQLPLLLRSGVITICESVDCITFNAIFNSILVTAWQFSYPCFPGVL